MYFKVEACGDTVYVEAPTQEGAREYLFSKMGEIPDNLLTFTVVKKLPKDEELL